MKYQKLKNLLIEVQKDKSKTLLKETMNYRNSDDYKIKLGDLVKEILTEYDPQYAKAKAKEIEIQNNAHWGYKGGAWKRNQGEPMWEYEDRVKKADTRLGVLVGELKSEVADAWKELSQIPTISKMDNKTKEDILMVITSKLDTIAGEMLKTLSVYPFEWDFYEDNLGDRIKNL